MTKRESPRERKPASKSESNEELTFEVALERLAEVVDRLEGGELELEESLQTFERGVELSRRCASELEVAERRIETLLRDSEGWLVRPFPAGPGEGDADDADDSEEDW